MSSSSTTSSNSSPSSTAISPVENEKSSPKIPTQWLATSLAVTTVAASILVPGIIILRRRQQMVILKHAAPPRRVQASSASDSFGAVQAGGQSARVADVSPTLASTFATRNAGLSSSTSVGNPQGSNDLEFSPMLYTLKAFGIATLFVTAGAMTAFWGVKSYLGVHDTRELPHELRDRMRKFVVTKMPSLSARIQRSHLDEDPLPSSSAPSPASVTSSSSLPNGSMEWTWPAAEERLKVVYNEGGVAGWGEAVLRELEEEERVERSKRNMMKEEDVREA
ncbi:hypothetical protein D9758_008566 [Tetrapyrgos nigripes]|uniref:Uncharacterized protein n=1 Tax=Tetrapyrgos nigripes TaxID=182062 RepID=A0A8H5LIP5_9AGAR|nr:hypothetical protein D9758_008566 [Tetrapyrgos nigripes]